MAFGGVDASGAGGGGDYRSDDACRSARKDADAAAAAVSPAKSPSSSILEPLESGLLWLTQATQSVTEQVLFFSTFGLIGGGTSSKAAAASAPQLRPTSCARLGVDAYGVYS